MKIVFMEDLKGLSTLCIHAGNPPSINGEIMPPIVLTTTFERQEDQISYHDEYIYSRYDNPNRRTIEVKLALMEGGEKALAFSSGLMAATAIFQSLKSGDHILLPEDIYFGVKKIVMRLYEQWGLTFDAVDMSDLEKVRSAIKPNTKILWMETPSNPCVKVSDIKGLVKIAKDRNILTVADNTWATPYFTKPIEYGVDIVLHSTTKYLGGHSDILGGALIFRQEDDRYLFIKDFQKLGGGVPSPFECWLLARSLATFAIRMPVHATNAMALASYLNDHEKIDAVYYPGLPDFPGHTIAKEQMKGGYGGMLSILVKGGREAALALCKELKLIRHATSLGGVESLIEHRKSAEGDLSSTPENLLRISVGVEHIDDLINDFQQALLKI